MNPREVAGLASTRTYPLRSSFRPSYNMAVNLVNQFGKETSRALLEQSFAQFQADRAVVGLARQLRKSDDALEGYREAATCHLGDFMEYAGMRRRISDLEKGASKAKRADRREEALESLAQLKPGDVIQIPARQVRGLRGRGGPRLQPRGTATVRRHRRPAGPTARDDRLPDPRRRADPAEGAQVVQRPQPADAARPRRRRCGPAPTTSPRRRPGKGGAGARADPRATALRSTRRSARSGPTSRRTRATPARTARTTRAGPSATSSWSATRTRCVAAWSAAPTRSPGSSTGSARC